MSTSPSGSSKVSQIDRFTFDCDHLLRFCSKFNQGTDSDQSESVLEAKLKELISRWRKLELSYENIMLSHEDADLKNDAQLNFDACGEAYYHCTSQITDLIKVNRTDPIQGYDAAPRLNNPTLTSTQNLTSENSNLCIKVPPCDTEIFEGSYEQWPSFRDMFTAVYINHTKLSAVTKLYHLRNKTTGEAGAIVKRYPLCHDNFWLAWDALRSRYENKRVLVDNQIKILFNILPASNEDSESIRRIQSSVNDSLATLKTLGVEVESWDPILIRLISTKLPDVTLSLWEQSLKSPRDLPKWSQMSQFLVERYEAVERLSSIRISKESFEMSRSARPSVQTYTSQNNFSSSCKICKQNHTLKTCPRFLSFTVQQRIDYVYKNKFCNNCLSHTHIRANCPSKHTCFICKKPHHTMLHIRRDIKNIPTITDPLHNTSTVNNSYSGSSTNELHNGKSETDNEYPHTSKQVQANFSASNEKILLRTAVVEIEHQGELFTVRALIDPGSQRTFVTERLRNQFQLSYQKSQFEIVGIGGQKQFADKECELVLYAKRYNLRFNVRAIVLPKVTKYLPESSFQIPISSEILELDLADPNFNKSSQIDLIIGNDYEHFVNIEGIKKNISGTTSAYNTVFGWVLSGRIKPQPISSFTTSVIASETAELNDTLKKFWEQEELPIIRPTSEEDEFCEKFYTETTKRDENGRYIVKLPFRKNFPHNVFLGSSRFLALAQYSNMEKAFLKNPQLQSQYGAVLNEYLLLGHMEETSSQEISLQGKYSSFYLPHHAVIRPEHKTTKIRVVFNASRKTKSNFSLNDILCTGPTLQSDLMTILLNWRKYKYVFSGDIEKMYRQILVDPADRPFQRILFQNEAKGPIRDYQLKTVTFGVNCAPFLAIRTLLKIATDYEPSQPRAANILRKETYVDDILSGGHSIEDALLAQKEIIEVLKSAGMPLRKITANDQKLLESVPRVDLYDLDFLKFQESSSTKTLGIRWNALTDTFTYSFSSLQKSTKMTKRQILSSVAKLFDPAGWLAPVIIRAKLLMQQIWLEGLEWDEHVSAESLLKWSVIVNDLPDIEKIYIPRWVQYNPTDLIEIHGFSDASKSAYCATVYLRVQNDTNVYSNLLVAKSKVAPVKTVCLPRLELNGAVLLANLANYVSSSITIRAAQIYLWTDSSIVLGWLSKVPSTWETYVANRIAEIHRLVPNAIWRHVPTHDNPADLGTRGCKPTDLSVTSIWWQGPTWLVKPREMWPQKIPLKQTDTFKRVQTLHAMMYTEDILRNFSSYNRALIVISYVFRFINKLKHKHSNYPSLSLTQIEVKMTKMKLLVLAQRQFYNEEYLALLNSQPITNKSALKNLNPFIDYNSVLRVNGRLSQSSLPYSERYPIILPGNSRFCHLYLHYLHNFLHHGECNQMHRMVQTEFYVSRLKPRIKNIIRQCKPCIVYKQKTCSQIMAPLPPERCQLSHPFQITGIDFAGPFELKSSSLRKCALIKGYVCVFVCFSTKAIHLEACSGLSSAAFQAAFARFVGRRGLPQRIMSDNGRNFIGASRTLLREFASFTKSIASDISHKYITQGFEWKFIPPHAPHMGGLWEAAVKSLKFHLKRVTGAQKFTFEELSTILARIEGVLNSRPISALSEDPNDLTALTPGHFLRGAPILALPEHNLQDMSLVNRWEKLKTIHHQFAIRWREDYLKSLHRRYKWQNPSRNLTVNDLVVVVDDIQPPYEWRLGRIVKTYPGHDTNVRTADVRISSGVITRPIVKLCYLPFLNESEDRINSYVQLIYSI